MQLINILKQKTTDDGVKKYAVKYMQDVGSFDYSKKRIGELKERAVMMIDRLEDGSGAERGVRRIVDGLDVE